MSLIKITKLVMVSKFLISYIACGYSYFLSKTPWILSLALLSQFTKAVLFIVLSGKSGR